VEARVKALRAEAAEAEGSLRSEANLLRRAQLRLQGEKAVAERRLREALAAAEALREQVGRRFRRTPPARWALLALPAPLELAQPAAHHPALQLLLWSVPMPPLPTCLALRHPPPMPPCLQVAELERSCAKLRVEVAERDGVIGDNYGTIQGLRRRLADLEKHKFVLGYKVGCLRLVLGAWRLVGGV
jgi:hypothetical protein